MSDKNDEIEFQHNGRTYSRYISDPGSIQNNIDWIKDQFVEFLNISSENPDDYDIDIGLMTKAFVRLDQRVLHYIMYHKGLIINELKYISILSYWIMRYRPILVVRGINSAEKSSVKSAVNEHFCIYLITGAIKQYRAIRKESMFELNDDIIKDIYYYFRNRQTSYDSIVILVENMAKTL